MGFRSLVLIVTVQIESLKTLKCIIIVELLKAGLEGVVQDMKEVKDSSFSPWSP